MTHPNQQPDPSNRNEYSSSHEAGRRLGSSALHLSFNGDRELAAQQRFNTLHPATSDERFHGEVTTLSGLEQIPFGD